MAFCSNCGAALEEGVRFCPQCGRELGMGVAAGGPATPRATVPAEGLAPNVAGLLCYLAWFVTGIIFLVLEPYNRDPFVRFHAFQSIFASVALFVLAVIVSVLGMIPILGAILMFLFWLGTVALWVVLMIQAYQNQRWKLPVLGDLAEKQVGSR